MASSDGDDSSSPSAVLEVTSQPKKISNSNRSHDTHSNSHDSSNEGSDIVNSPSAESISTFQELDKTELMLDRGSDIVSHVDGPQKIVEPWGTYVTFRIRTKTTRWDPDVREYTVHRRYNDFKALREKLVEASLQVVPPLPSPHTLIAQLDRFSRDFVLQRMVLLNIFIKRLVSHSILTHNNDLKIFLTANTSEFAHHFKSKAGYLSNISDSICNFATPNISSSLGSVCRVRDPEFSSISDYMTSLHEKLMVFNSISLRITKERADISTEMKALKPILENWSQVERFNRDTLKTTHKKSSDTYCYTDENFLLGTILKKMSKPFGTIAAEHHKLTKEYPYIIANPIKEYILYIEAVKDKLTKRDALQGSLETVQEKLARKKERTNGANGDESGVQLPKLVQEVGECHDKLQCASEALRSDLHGWQRQKKTDLKLVLLEISKRHIEFHEKSLNSWEAVMMDEIANFNQLHLTCVNNIEPKRTTSTPVINL